MTRRVVWGAAAVVVAAAVVAIAMRRLSRPAAIDVPPAPSVAREAVPRLPGGIPDLSGVWQGGGPVADIAAGLPRGETIPIAPAAQALMGTRRSQDDPSAHCLPDGVPRQDPYPWRIVQTPERVFILFEGNTHSYRQIFVDGRPHPDHLRPTWWGHSIGRYDDNALVVDTVGYNDKFWFDFRGHPHTTRLHTVERFARRNRTTMLVSTTPARTPSRSP